MSHFHVLINHSRGFICQRIVLRKVDFPAQFSHIIQTFCHKVSSISLMKNNGSFLPINTSLKYRILLLLGSSNRNWNFGFLVKIGFSITSILSIIFSLLFAQPALLHARNLLINCVWDLIYSCCLSYSSICNASFFAFSFT